MQSDAASQAILTRQPEAPAPGATGSTTIGARLVCPDNSKQVQTRLGVAIRRRRQLLGLSLSELATACGVSFQQVQKYELGISRISAAQLWKIAAPLGVPVAYFYEGLRPAQAR